MCAPAIVAVADLLRKHKHESHGGGRFEAHLSPQTQNDDNECRDLLISVRDTLSSLLSISVEPCGTGPVISHTHATVEDALGTCTILRLLLSSEVCPHALAAFDYGGNDYKEFVPHFLQLFALVRSEPQSAATRLRPAVIETLGLMAELVHHDDCRETYLALAHDVVSLLCDLHVVSVLATPAEERRRRAQRDSPRMSITAFTRFGASHAAPKNAPIALQLAYDLDDPLRSTLRTLRLQTWATALLLELHVRPGVQSLDGVVSIRQRVWSLLCSQVRAWRHHAGRSSDATTRARNELTTVTLTLAVAIVARGSVSSDVASRLQRVLLAVISTMPPTLPGAHSGTAAHADCIALDDLAAQCLQKLAALNRSELLHSSGPRLATIAALRASLACDASTRLQCALMDDVALELRALTRVAGAPSGLVALQTLLLALPLLTASFGAPAASGSGGPAPAAAVAVTVRTPRSRRALCSMAGVIAAALDAVPAALRECVWQRRGVMHLRDNRGDNVVLVLPEKKRQRLSFGNRRVRIEEDVSAARVNAVRGAGAGALAGEGAGGTHTLASALCQWTETESAFLLGFDALLSCALASGDPSAASMDALLVALLVFNEPLRQASAVTLRAASGMRSALLEQLWRTGSAVISPTVPSVTHFDAVVNGAIVALHRCPIGSALSKKTVQLMTYLLETAMRAMEVGVAQTATDYAAEGGVGDGNAPSRLRRRRVLRFPEGSVFSLIDAANEIAFRAVEDFDSRADLVGLFELPVLARCLVFAPLVAPELCWAALTRAGTHSYDAVSIVAAVCVPFAVLWQQQRDRNSHHERPRADIVDLTGEGGGESYASSGLAEHTARRGRETLFAIGGANEKAPLVRAAAIAALNAIAVLACAPISHRAAPERAAHEGRLHVVVPGLDIHDNGDAVRAKSRGWDANGRKVLAVADWRMLWTWMSRSSGTELPSSPAQRSTREGGVRVQVSVARVFAAAAAANVLRRAQLRPATAHIDEFQLVRDFIDLLQDAHRPIRDVVARKMDILVAHPALVAACGVDAVPSASACESLGGQAGAGAVPLLLKSLQDSAPSAFHVASVLSAIGTIGCASPMHDVLLRWSICALITKWTDVHSALIKSNGRSSSWHARELRLVSTVAVDELQRIAGSKNHSVWALLAVHIPNIGAFIVDALLTSIKIGEHELVHAFHKDVLLDQLLEVEFWRNGGTVDLPAFVMSCMHVAVPYLVMQGDRDDQPIEKLCALLSEFHGTSVGAAAAGGGGAQILKDMTPYVLHKTFTNNGNEDVVQANAMRFLKRIGIERPSLRKVVNKWFHEIMMLILWDTGGSHNQQKHAEIAFGVVAKTVAGTTRLDAVSGGFAATRDKLLQKYFLFFLVVIDRCLDERRLRANVDIVGQSNDALAALRVQSASNRQFCISADKLGGIQIIVTVCDDILSPGVQAIRCLNWLIKQLEVTQGADKHVHKIMSTLKTALCEPTLASAACDAWDALVQALSTGALRTNLSAIVAELFAYSEVEEQPAGVRTRVLKVLRYLIVERSATLRGSFGEIPSIPSGDDFDEIRESVESVCDDWHDPERRIPQLVKLSTEHVSPKVRQLALTALLRMLDEHAGEVYSLAGKEGSSASRLIRDTMGSLLKRCKTETDGTATLLLAKCLGQLGAIDPARLNLSIHPLAESSKELGAVDLAVQLLRTNLVAVHRSASVAHDQDRVSYAFQELLSFLRDTLGSSSEADFKETIGRYFRRHPEEFELIEPYLETNYEIVPGVGGGATILHPLYGQSIVTDHKEWMAALSRKVCDAAQGDLKRIFVACRGVFRVSTELAQFLLPYMVKAVLQTCEGGGGSGAQQRRGARTQSARAGIQKEVLAVLQDTADRRKVGESMALLCTQSVFSLLDTLKRWRRDTTDDVAPDVATPLMSAISERVLANAAFRCKAYARALLHLETDLQNFRRNPARSTAVHARVGKKQCWIEAPDLAYLQRIYAHLDKDDPDALPGIATLRLRVSKAKATTLEERIIDYESASQWSSALASYEQLLLLHHRPPASVAASAATSDATSVAASDIPQAKASKNDIELHQGTLRCMTQLGHLETVIRHVKGIAAQRTESGSATNARSLASHLVPHAVEAAWRLGQWDVLGTLLEEMPYHGGSIGRNEMWIGSALLGLQRRNLVQVQRSVEGAQRELMGPLAAATSESYSRAYPLLLQLHQLREIEHAAKLINVQLREERDAHGGAEVAHARAPMMQMSFPDALSAPEAVAVRLNPSSTMRRFRWDERLALTATSFHHRVDIIVLRRAVASIFDLKREQADLWDQLATTARKAGNFAESSRAILHLDELGKNREARIERAKNLRAQGKIQRALVELEPVAIDPAEYVHVALEKGHDVRSKLANQLLIATMWMQDAGLKQGQGLIDRFKAVTRLQPQWDQAHFQLGRYYDYMLRDLEKKMHAARRGAAGTSASVVEAGNKLRQRKFLYTMLTSVLESYGHALMYGHTYLFEAMPRLLTLWFTYGGETDARRAQAGPAAPTRSKSKRGAAAVKEARKRSSASAAGDETSKLDESTFVRINEIIEDLHTRLPAYQFLTALPQLLSRVCHPSKGIADLLKEIIARILDEYPQQAMWFVMGLLKSKIRPRRQSAKDIISLIKDPRVKALIKSADKTFDELIKVAKTKPSSNAKKKMSISVKANRHIARGDRSGAISMIVPTQRALTVTLPRNNGNVSNRGEVQSDANAHIFGGNAAPVTLRSVGSEAVVYFSKERPKKITLHGDDGKQYFFLCKQENAKKGDLRKDARMMEINNVVNRLLKHDDGGRRRKLSLRTYAVMCLNEECGLMEWVNNTVSSRSLIEAMHAKHVSPKPTYRRLMDRIKERYNALQADMETDLGVLALAYETDILSTYFPPMFHRWFVEHFPDPSAWFEARLAYSRSAATWSMVGYIVGLGDRHCENILIDTSNGECVHVDFDCLFDKGLTFSVPEMVPFRLTPNIIDAMGVCGVEGAFRNVCETTMTVLRRESEMLMNVLDAFVHDPLIEFAEATKHRVKSSTGGSQEDSVNAEALLKMKKIQGRLSGIYDRDVEAGTYRRSKRGRQISRSSAQARDSQLALSIQGQVHRLIEEASSNKNLHRMYIGWQPWM